MPLYPRDDRRYHVLYDTHAWVGVGIGLVLYVMMLTGVVSLYFQQLEAWEEPAHHLEATAPDPDRWWNEAAALGSPHRLVLVMPDPAVGKNAPTAILEDEDHHRTTFVRGPDGWHEDRSHAALLLFRFHFLYHDAAPILYTVAGLISMLFGVALLTGLGIHLRDLIPQLRQFRPHRPANVAWADLHKVTAVTGLPFQAMMAWTGALIILGNYTIAAVGLPLFGGDIDRAQHLAFGAPLPEPTVEMAPAPQAAATLWLAQASDAIEGLEVRRIQAEDPGLSTTRVRVSGALPDLPGLFHVTLSGPDGTVLRADEPTAEPAPLAAQRWLFALHFAQLGGWLTTLLYAVLGVAAAVAIVTGNALFLRRRRQRADRAADTALARLTVGVAAGTPVAIAATLLASRLLPWSLEGRDGWLELTFVGGLLACCGVAGAMRQELRCAAGLTALGGLLMLATVPAQALVTGRVPFAGAPVLTSVDLGLSLCGVLLLATAYGLTVDVRAVARRALEARHA